MFGKRLFSSTPAAFKLKPHVPRTTAPTRPNVYGKLNAILVGESLPLHPLLPSDAVDALTAAAAVAQARFARLASSDSDAAEKKALETELGVKKNAHPHERFLARLKADGGDKIVTFRKNILHTEHTRFVPLLSDIRGLSLADAFNQLKWHRKRISKKVVEALEKAVVKAKDEAALDLNKTYVADAYIKDNGAILSQQFTKRFLRGRGRYGSTQHAITGLLEITLQEREAPFARRVADPLEWVRKRLRDRVAGGAVVDVEKEVYSQVVKNRVVKEIHC
ncbi:UNVERIFIED_CONTAM: hypothetical protein HDU68_004682 [Siphonaria sp. JEL0065]|nr:hypothetical protein HDU68_004682 [Siphonaria sp. JEL0065]